MRNIWTVFKTDIRTLSRCFFACVVVVAIALLPSLYAWLNIYSNWDPYGNTGGISIAVASLDEGYTDEDGVYENKGQDVVDDLREATSINWVIVDTEEQAKGGVESKAANRADFYGMYGGLFFLGIMLSIVFIFAAVAILYYKQLSEGYEDQSRFDIMQKVGMTKGDIRRSINSQLLTVFYLPLLMAGLHLCFAFPFIHKLLMLFNLDNRGLLVGTTAVSFVVFAALYALVYKLTGNAYYHIVAENKE